MGKEFSFYVFSCGYRLKEKEKRKKQEQRKKERKKEKKRQTISNSREREKELVKETEKESRCCVKIQHKAVKWDKVPGGIFCVLCYSLKFKKMLM